MITSGDIRKFKIEKFNLNKQQKQYHHHHHHLKLFTFNIDRYCNLCYLRIKKGQQELQCVKCKLFYHRTCLNIDVDKYKLLKQEAWICKTCTTEHTPPICTICSKQRKTWISTKCKDCKQYYHRACIQKNSPKFQPDDFYWTCPTCTNDKDKLNLSTSDIESNTSSSETKLTGIPIGHINIRDIMALNKKDDICLSITQQHFHAFGTKDIPDDEIAISGYNVYRQDRPAISSHKQRGGGLLLYVKNIYDTVVHTYKLKTSTEILHVSIKHEYIPTIHFVLIYKPPTEKAHELASVLEQVLNQCNSEECYIIGDINVNFFRKWTSKTMHKCFNERF